MKFNIITIIIALTILFACKGNRNKKEDNQNTTNSEVTNDIQKGDITICKLIPDTLLMGEIFEGEIVSKSFKIKNVGDKPLIIKDIITSCGCTTPKYELDPILPGKEREIEIQFNSSGRSGKQYKVITIFANTQEGTMTLNMIVNIKQK